MWTWSGKRAGWLQASSLQGKRPGTGRLACVEAGCADSSRVIHPEDGKAGLLSEALSARFLLDASGDREAGVQWLDPRRLS